jgi:hypothetical protein
MESSCLPGPIPKAAIQLQRPGHAPDGGGRIPGHALHVGQQHQSVGLARPVAGLAGGAQRSQIQDEALIPVASGVQESVHRGGDQQGIEGPRGGGGIADGRVQVGTLGFQPGGRLLWRRYRRRAGRREARRRGAFGSGPRGNVLAGGQGGVQVVVQQPGGGGVPGGRVIGGGQDPGVLADQVVEPVPAAGGLGDQVLVIEGFQAPARSNQADAIQRRGGIAVDVGTGMQARRRNSRLWPSSRSW